MIDTLLPERCPACRGPTTRGLCRGCRERLVVIDDPCPGCAMPRPVSLCPRRRADWQIDAVIAPWRFCAPLDQLIHALKFHGARSHGRALGLLLAATPAIEAAPIDALVAVPLHSSRLRQRGYNQALEIARPLSRRLGARLPVRGIHRVVATHAQPGLPRRLRYGNVADAFSVSRRFDGQRIAIVDDVLTSGATVSALAAALRTAGATAVSAWSVARTL